MSLQESYQRLGRRPDDFNEDLARKRAALRRTIEKATVLEQRQKVLEEMVVTLTGPPAMAASQELEAVRSDLVKTLGNSDKILREATLLQQRQERLDVLRRWSRG